MKNNIKFKAWVKSMKKLHEWGVNLISVNHDLSWESLSDGMFDKDDSILYQFSGIKDIHNNDIYFGCDIVKVTVGDDLGLSEDTIMEGVLYLSKKRFKICLKGHEDFSLQYADKIEIIGNIYDS